MVNYETAVVKKATLELSRITQIHKSIHSLDSLSIESFQPNAVDLEWVKHYHRTAHCDTAVATMLVGNKCDLENIRDISVDEGKGLAESEGLFFMETSALDSTNVKKAFEIVIKEIYSNLSRKVLNSDSYKAELSLNRVSLTSNDTDESKQSSKRFSCC